MTYYRGRHRRRIHIDPESVARFMLGALGCTALTLLIAFIGFAWLMCWF